MSKSLPGQKKITTVWLESEIGSGGNDKTKMFYCFNCRIPLIQYKGNVVTIVPGSQPYEPSTILKCKGNIPNANGTWEECGVHYSFAGTVYGFDIK